MSNLMLGFPNLIEGATLSGGSFVASLPRDNIKNRVLSKVARTTNTTASNTFVDIDLGKQKIVHAFGAFNHNFSIDATFRVRASDVSDFSTMLFDTGVKLVWPVVYPYGTLEWEDDNWWSGQYTAEETEGYTTALILTTQATVFARYWRFEVFDTTNADTFLEWGRIFLGRVWQPAHNMIYGASLGWEPKTEVQEAMNGTEYFNKRKPLRKQKFTLDAMTEDEAFAKAFEIQRRAGVDQEILFIHNQDDTVHAIRRQFLGRLSTLSPIEYPYFATNKAAFEIKELL